jgi:hypothetical protein
LPAPRRSIVPPSTPPPSDVPLLLALADTVPASVAPRRRVRPLPVLLSAVAGALAAFLVLQVRPPPASSHLETPRTSVAAPWPAIADGPRATLPTTPPRAAPPTLDVPALLVAGGWETPPEWAPRPR